MRPESQSRAGYQDLLAELRWLAAGSLLETELLYSVLPMRVKYLANDTLILAFEVVKTLTTRRRVADEKDMQERRTDNRLLCAELVEVIWTDNSGLQRRRVANLEDISSNGICLQVENPVLAGTAVTMRYGDGELVGIVRYCTFKDAGYFLGIQFEEGCRWSTQHFRPEHLIDPGELVKQAISRHSSNSDSSERN